MAAKKQTRWGFRRDGAWAIAPRFEKVEPFHQGLAAVRLEGKWGYVDREGEVVISPRFDRCPPPFTDGNFAGHTGLDRSGVVRFTVREQGSEGLFPCNEGGQQAWDGQWGFRDSDTGEIVVPAAFAEVTPFWGPWAGAMKWIEDVGGRWGLIDRAGGWVVPPEYVLCSGVDARGGLFANQSEEGTFTWGAVHPERGVVEPFVARPLYPDPSRLDPSVVRSKPRTPEDEALVPEKALVAVVEGPPRYPFRFYGHGAGQGAGLLFRIRFERRVDLEAARAALAEITAFGDGPFGPGDRDGDFVLFGTDDLEALELVPEYEEAFVEAFRALHARFPIVEVVNVAPGECESPWETWSTERQEFPDEGPTFGFPWPWS